MKNLNPVLKHFWSVLLISLFQYEIILILIKQFTNLWFQSFVVVSMIIIYFSINYTIKKKYV